MNYKTCMVTAAILMLSVFGAGCRGCGHEEPAVDYLADGRAFLAEHDIDPSSIHIMGDDIFMTYEASQALEYDGQLLVTWGTILGVLAEYVDGTVTIVNTAGGKPALLVKARSADVRAYGLGEMTWEELVNSLQISAAGE